MKNSAINIFWMPLHERPFPNQHGDQQFCPKKIHTGKHNQYVHCTCTVEVLKIALFSYFLPDFARWFSSSFTSTKIQKIRTQCPFSKKNLAAETILKTDTSLNFLLEAVHTVLLNTTNCSIFREDLFRENKFKIAESSLSIRFKHDMSSYPNPNRDLKM